MHLKRFLNGPLLDKHGGTAALRTVVADYLGYEECEMDAVEEKTSTPAYSLIKSSCSLFPYQEDIKQQVVSLVDAREKSAALASLPTGGGKTRTAIEIFHELSVRRQCRMLWVAPSRELVDQAADTVKDLWDQFSGRENVHLYCHNIGSPHADDAVASFITVQKAVKNIRSMVAYNPTLFVFDEAHFAPATSFARVVGAIKDQTDAFVLGLSATPGRTGGDENSLVSLFENCLITSKNMGKNPVDFLREQKVLARMEMNTISLPEVWDKVRVKDPKARGLTNEELAIQPARFWATIDTLKNMDERCKCLVFAEDLVHAEVLAAVAKQIGLSAETISYKTSPAKRQSVLDRFESGDIQFLMNKTLLATGYDCPSITDIVLATPVRSPILWEQMLGRVSRGPAVGGTSIGRVWELDGHREMHGSVLSYARYRGEYWE